jgi:hypothetical protein
MKNFTITESEKKEIKQLYGVLNEDQKLTLAKTNFGNLQIGDTIYEPFTKKGFIEIPVTITYLKPLGGNNGYELEVDTKITDPTKTTISQKRINDILTKYNSGKPDKIESQPDTEDGKVIILKKKVK